MRDVVDGIEAEALEPVVPVAIAPALDVAVPEVGHDAVREADLGADHLLVGPRPFQIVVHLGVAHVSRRDVEAPVRGGDHRKVSPAHDAGVVEAGFESIPPRRPGQAVVRRARAAQCGVPELVRPSDAIASAADGCVELVSPRVG